MMNMTCTLVNCERYPNIATGMRPAIKDKKTIYVDQINRQVSIPDTENIFSFPTNTAVTLLLLSSYPKQAYLKQFQLREALVHFEMLVNRYEAKKLPYSTWRGLKNMSELDMISYLLMLDNDCYIAGLVDDKQEVYYENVPESFYALLKSYSTPISIPVVRSDSIPYFAKKQEVKELVEQKQKQEEKEITSTMKMNNMMKFEFGPAGDKVRYSPYGIAVTENGTDWFSYNPNTKQVIDVCGFAFDLSGLIMKMPVAPKDVKPGDLIDHKGKPVYVTNIFEDDTLEVIDILDSEVKNTIPVTNMFGFNFITKYVPLMNLGGGTPSADNPFGSDFGSILAMQALFDDGEGFGFGDGSDMKDMFKTIAMMNFFNRNAGGLFGNMFNPTANT